MVNTFNMTRQFAWVLALCLSFSVVGCISTGSTDVSQLSTYLPDESGRDVWAWDASGAGTTGAISTAAGTGGAILGRSLRKGDKVEISLTGIPEPTKISNVVNDSGFVTLPLIGSVKIAGLTTAKAEVLIRGTYIREQYYKSIDVIVVAQQGEFYVRGEVKREGVFQLSGDITLAQAIIMAGGYTDFAKKSEVKLIRGSDTTMHDAGKSEKGEAENPLIRTGDMIVVPRRVW